MNINCLWMQQVQKLFLIDSVQWSKGYALRLKLKMKFECNTCIRRGQICFCYVLPPTLNWTIPSFNTQIEV